jgi:hypothetical protein
LTGSTSTVTTIPGTAYKLVNSADPSTIEITSLSISTITTRILDYYNNLVNIVPDSTKQIIFKISGEATWSDGSTQDKKINATGGIAMIGIKSKNTIGTITVTSSSTYVVGGSIIIPVIVGNPVKIICSVNPMSITADGISVSTIQANILNVDNYVVTNATNVVTFTITDQAGKWSDGSVGARFITPADGLATISLRSTVNAGQITVTANSYGLTGSTVTVTTVHGPANKLDNDVFK